MAGSGILATMGEGNSRLGLDWVAVAAAALASVSSAVILSTLGASGTLIGAAVGSVVATVSSAMYSRGLQSSKEKVAVVFQGGGVGEVSRDEAERLEAEGALAAPEVSEAVLGPEATQDARGEGRRTFAERFKAINWRKVAPWAIGTFVVVMVAITAFEMVTGKPVSSLTGGSDGTGTSIGRVVDRGSDHKKNDKKQPDERPGQPGRSEQPGDDPTDAPTSSAPSTEPTTAPSETPSEAPTTNEPTPTEPTPQAPEETPFLEDE